MQTIKKGDLVQAIAGRERGKQGKIISVQGDWCKVEGLNMRTRHQKPNPNLNIEGGRIRSESVIHRSNVMLVDDQGKPSRVGIRVEDGKKARYFKTTGTLVDTQKK